MTDDDLYTWAAAQRCWLLTSAIQGRISGIEGDEGKVQPTCKDVSV
jgi:hypothetical protein